VRLLALLAAILLASGAMFMVCVAVGLLISLNTFAFMAAEVFNFDLAWRLHDLNVIFFIAVHIAFAAYFADNAALLAAPVRRGSLLQSCPTHLPKCQIFCSEPR
jgi:hypothetical protein